MEKQSEKTTQEQKADIIRKFAEAIDRNTTTPHEVWCIIHALQDAAEYMEDKRYKYPTDLAVSIRLLRERHTDSSELILYNDLSDELQEAIMIAGANAEGLVILNRESLRDALHKISEIYYF